MRWISLVAGAALVVLAFAAVTRVSDSREGLVAEAITLLGGLAGIGLLVYGLAARRTAAGRPSLTRQLDTRPSPRPRANRDLVFGAGGIALALLLLGGLAISGGVLWAALGLALMLPMISGSVYLCVRFLRASP
ncbi:MAG TPA: hypothetical protein VGE99_05840 [Candidatus Dormibacteraeota bacterium]